MRLNERSVAEFSTSSAPIDKEGHLNKKGELNRGYQRRWFVLKGNLLYYFERRSDKEPIGVIVLDNCHVELAESGEPYAFQINFGGDGVRTYVLGADTPQEMEAWMRALTHANYDYLSMMVSEFEADLCRLTSEEDELVNNIGGNFAAKGASLLPSGVEAASRDHPDARKSVEAPLFDSEDAETHSLPTSPRPRSSQLSSELSPVPLLIDFDSDPVDLPGHEEFSFNAALSSASRLSDVDLMHVSFSELQRLEELHTDELLQLGSSKFYSKDDSLLSQPEENSAKTGISRQPRWKSERRRNNIQVGSGSFNVNERSWSIGRSVIFDVDKIQAEIDSQSVFRHLHDQYGASIWVKVKEYGKQDVPK